MNSSNEVLITLDEAARRCSLSKRTLQREIVRGRFPQPLRISKCCSRVRPADVLAYIEALAGPGRMDPYLRKNPTAGILANTMDVEMVQRIDAAKRGVKPPGMTDEEFERRSLEYHAKLAKHVP